MKIELILADIFIPKLKRAIASLTRTEISITEITPLQKTKMFPDPRHSTITIESPADESFFFLGIAFALDPD